MVLSINTTTRPVYESAVRYSNGPFRRGSTSSTTWSALPSPVSSPLPAYSPSHWSRTTINSSPTIINPFAESKIELIEIRLNLVCNWLYQKQVERQWSTGNCDEEGVMVRKGKNEYICCPAELSASPSGLHDAIREMNVKCAMTVNTRTTRLMLDMHEEKHIPLQNGLRLQVLPDYSALSKCQKNQSAAFIKHPPMLVIWDDDPASILERAKDLEAQLMPRTWNRRSYSNQSEVDAVGESMFPEATDSDDDVELLHSPRKIVLIQSIVVSLTLLIACLALGGGWRSTAIEIKVQQNWLYLLIPIVGPLQAWLGLFFFQTLPTCIAQVIGPVRQLKQNSAYYSGRPSPRLRGSILPHVTIQCPVYKESLALVIEPTIKSIKAAISTYEMQGGTANIFINDDGLQVIASNQVQERREFYEEHGIGWVARPRHNFLALDSKKVFVRAGKFKKASNMNYALNISMRIEAKLQRFQRPDDWTDEEELDAYNQALAEVVAEDRGRTWASGNVRIGDYILLIDSDTRVPRDCLLDAVSEMEQSPHVAILQFSSSVLNVTNTWFEKGITFFTHLVYTAIEFAVANGDVAPFVGHNALLRWSALQDVATTSPEEPMYQTFWSEDTVSEDFDMALRLQTSGYTLRLAAYARAGFKEGVSLTVYDELARWEKYAYGCSELIFHPFTHWITKGPFTSLFRRFMFSSIPLHSKVSIMAYVGTYFAIASSWLLTLLNYFAIGWYNGYLDHYYMESFRIYFSVFVLFNIIGNIALAVLRYRTNEKKLLPSLLENFKWVLLLSTFLGGMSLHVSQAILCHLFSVDMTWGATSKEAASTSFFREIPIILRKFRVTFVMCFVLTITMIVLAGLGPFQETVPYDWQITQFTAITPLALMVAAHALLPLALNPGLMQFTF